MTNWENGGGGFQIVEPDFNSPDKILARKEPLHPDDPEDCDHELAPCDGGETIDFQAIKSVPRDALKILLRVLIPSDSPSERKRWRGAQIRLAILAHLIDLDGIGSKSFQDLGEDLGCSRALLSLYSLRMIDALQINKTRNGKRRESRETFRESAIASHRRQGHAIKADAAGADSADRERASE